MTQVKLISYSKPSEFTTYDDGAPLDCQDLIAFCARVSNPSNQMNKETNEKLQAELMEIGKKIYSQDSGENTSSNNTSSNNNDSVIDADFSETK